MVVTAHHRRLGFIVPALLVSAVVALPLRAGAETARRQEPLLAVHLQPSLSVMLPTGGALAVTEVYGQTHPTGAIGISIHPHRRYTIVAELEVQGWKGELPEVRSGVGETIGAFSLSFLNYWISLRNRFMIVRAGRFQLHLDAIIGAIVSREDGDRFRAEGAGVSVGAGPVAWLSLGRYVALSLSAIVESGWVWYDIESPQSADGANSYSLMWPRFMLGLGFHGIFVHRREGRRSSVRTTTVTPPQPEPEPAPAPVPTAVPAAPTAPSSTQPPAQEPATNSEQGLATPW